MGMGRRGESREFGNSRWGHGGGRDFGRREDGGARMGGNFEVPITGPGERNHGLPFGNSPDNQFGGELFRAQADGGARMGGNFEVPLSGGDRGRSFDRSRHIGFQSEGDAAPRFGGSYEVPPSAAGGVDQRHSFENTIHNHSGGAGGFQPPRDGGPRFGGNYEVPPSKPAGGERIHVFDSPPSNHSGGIGGFRPPVDAGFRPPVDVGFQPPIDVAARPGPSYEAPLSGQKRAFPFSPTDNSPEPFDHTRAVKLFIGSVPRTITVEDVRPLFEQHGNVLEVALIKDKITGQQQGCCFIKYATPEEADKAIRALHNRCTLPGGVGPIQVRYADGERERLGLALVEHKLFVGSLNKQATLKEVEEIFLPYGQVEDVYLMQHNRGCGFVKYSEREMAIAAINALNGRCTMKGCDQPLTVRFAEPKRQRFGEPSSLRNPAFGGPGLGPRFQAPGVRPTTSLNDSLPVNVLPNSWNPMKQQNAGPSPTLGAPGFSIQMPQRAGEATTNTDPSQLGDMSLAGSVPSSTPVQNFNQPPSLVTSSQRPPHLSQQFPPSQQLHSQTVAPESQNLPSFASQQPPNALPTPNSSTQMSFKQAAPSPPLPGAPGQLAAPQPQAQQNVASTNVHQTPVTNNYQPYSSSSVASQQRLPPFQQQSHSSQPSSQLAELVSKQTQTLQASYQSSKQAFSQLQQQLQMMQPTNQSAPNNQQQPQWSGLGSQIGASTFPSTPIVNTSSGAPSATQSTAPETCCWTEHLSPDGYKYYYNSTTGESRWDKPDELKLHEEKEKQEKTSVQQLVGQPMTQLSSLQQPPKQSVQMPFNQAPSNQQAFQTHLVQPQSMFHPQQSYQQPPQQQPQRPFPSIASGAMSQQNLQYGYKQEQRLTTSSASDPGYFQQKGAQTAQGWAPKKTAGSDPSLIIKLSNGR
uniref:Flowering time control protein FCA n=1 Tax=Kalanchoe fedtschenkoi TaxID=63787 RepID=A0A7N0TSY2_KALFE